MADIPLEVHNRYEQFRRVFGGVGDFSEPFTQLFHRATPAGGMNPPILSHTHKGIRYPWMSGISTMVQLRQGGKLPGIVTGTYKGKGVEGSPRAAWLSWTKGQQFGALNNLRRELGIGMEMGDMPGWVKGTLQAPVLGFLAGALNTRAAIGRRVMTLAEPGSNFNRKNHIKGREFFNTFIGTLNATQASEFYEFMDNREHLQMPSSPQIRKPENPKVAPTNYGDPMPSGHLGSSDTTHANNEETKGAQSYDTGTLNESELMTRDTGGPTDFHIGPGSPPDNLPR